MKIGIIGAGHIGGTAARLLVEAGHEIAISNSRGPDTLKSLVRELGPGAHATTAEDAARFGDVVLLAIPLKDYETLSAELMRGKIAVDAMNYYPERDGHFPELDARTTTSSEMVAKHLSGARVVKAFNTIWVEHLKIQGNKSIPPEERRAIIVSGDDAEAKAIVTRLIEEIGFGAFDLGPLRGSARQQPDAPLYNRDVTVAHARQLLAAQERLPGS